MSDLSAQIRGGAIFSPCDTYRYVLWRNWSVGPMCCFIMLNPSTADATNDDPTVRRCIGFARRWGYGGVEVVNIFALRSTDPRALRRHVDPVGPDNDQAIRLAARRADRVVCAWGNHGRLHNRGPAVLAGLVLMGIRPLCFKLTKSTPGKPGQPEHPLYQKWEHEMQILWIEMA